LRIVVAPDSFKGSLSAVAVAKAMEQGILSVFPHAEVKKVPIADGGEGTVEALTLATGGCILNQKVMGPLGDIVEAYWGILGDRKTAVIEMASASGLPLVPKAKRNPQITTTYGTGQLIKAALDMGIRNLVIGIGGSATNDGGVGMASSLGVKFLDANGKELPNGGAALANLARIDLTEVDPRLADTAILVACDVNNPLCGPQGASAVYGPQKGATLEMVAELDDALKRYAGIAKLATGKDAAERPGAGAAGGLGAGLMFFTDAVLKPGVEIVLEAAGFADIVKKASFVITGEGRTDFQTAHGKAPVGVAKVAKRYDVPTFCLSGGLVNGCEAVLQQGIDGLMSIVPQPMTIEECMDRAEELVQTASARLCRLLKAGIEIGTNARK
jgi:glycerate kinase